MVPDADVPTFLIWGADNVVYGPVELPVLVHWVQEERVLAATWVHLVHENRWEPAEALAELQMFFRKRGPAAETAVKSEEQGTTAREIRPGALRRVKILACLSDDQLAQFVGFMEVRRARPWEHIIREGDPGDAMYLILEGEVRVRLMIAGKESILATLTAGEFFGEVALFDHGPRSADVVANQDCLLLRISTAAFQGLVRDKPSLAAPFLYAVSKTLISRIRADNKRYRDLIAIARTAH